MSSFDRVNVIQSILLNEIRVFLASSLSEHCAVVHSSCIRKKWTGFAVFETLTKFICGLFMGTAAERHHYTCCPRMKLILVV